MTDQRYELCSRCDEPTGRAGAGDDSIYAENGDGPFCLPCWQRLEDPTPWELGDTSGDATDAAYRQEEARKLK